jgi:hypothetical protein
MAIHEAMGLIWSCHVECDPGSCEDFLYLKELKWFGDTYQMNVADMPNQRPCCWDKARQGLMLRLCAGRGDRAVNQLTNPSAARLRR